MAPGDLDRFVASLIVKFGVHGFPLFSALATLVLLAGTVLNEGKGRVCLVSRPTLEVLVEEDFACLDRTDANEDDTFPNQLRTRLGRRV
jgi:hypothetical protein